MRRCLGESRFRRVESERTGREGIQNRRIVCGQVQPCRGAGPVQQDGLAVMERAHFVPLRRCRHHHRVGDPRPRGANRERLVERWIELDAAWEGLVSATIKRRWGHLLDYRL